MFFSRAEKEKVSTASKIPQVISDSRRRRQRNYGVTQCSAP